MPASAPIVNGLAPPQAVVLTWPAPTPVQLGNNNIGGEITYLWQIIDQPEGTADVLSNPNIQNPTLAPKKEGTYLLRLTVNAGLADEQVATALFWVPDLKTGLRLPAAGERLERDLVRGWATDANRVLNFGARQDPGLLVGRAGQVGLQSLQVIRASSTVDVKVGYPGEERLMNFTLAQASNLSHMRHNLFLLISGVDGAAAPGNNAFVIVRQSGLVARVPGGGLVANGTIVANSKIYVSDMGALTPFPSPTVPRQVAEVVSVDVAADTYDLYFDGRGQGGTRYTPGPMWGNATTLGGGTQVYLDLGYGARAAPELANIAGIWVPRRAGRMSRMRAAAVGPPNGGAQSFVIRRNNAPTLLNTAFIPPQVDAVDLINSFDYAPGDLIDCQVQTVNAAAAGAVILRIFTETTEG